MEREDGIPIQVNYSLLTSLEAAYSTVWPLRLAKIDA